MTTTTDLVNRLTQFFNYIFDCFWPYLRNSGINFGLKVWKHICIIRITLSLHFKIQKWRKIAVPRSSTSPLLLINQFVLNVAFSNAVYETYHRPVEKKCFNFSEDPVHIARQRLPLTIMVGLVSFSMKKGPIMPPD